MKKSEKKALDLAMAELEKVDSVILVSKQRVYVCGDQDDLLDIIWQACRQSTRFARVLAMGLSLAGSESKEVRQYLKASIEGAKFLRDLDKKEEDNEKED